MEPLPLPLPLLLLALTVGAAHNQGVAHQERSNRMVPDFQPYQHPARKVAGGPAGLHAGPMGEVHWVQGGRGEGGLPVFDHIHPPPPPAPSSSSFSPLLILLLLGGLGAAAVYKGKAIAAPPPCKEQKEESLPCQTWKEQREKVLPPPSPPTPPRISEKKEAASTPPPKLKAKMINEATNEKIVPVLIVTMATDATNGDVEAVKDINPETGESEDVVETKEWEKKVFEEEPITVSPKYREYGKINKETEETLEEPNYITKIKTFKITKYPKTNTAGIVQHDGDSLVSVLDVVLLQNAIEWKTDFQFVTAQLNIEGANMSRLRITVVSDTGEEEYVARTMTVREYMVSISNKIIEDAVKAVRENCSIDNIRHLADTIKKYRPESSEVKTVRKL